ncbi:Integrase [Lactococcus lactis subsp. lactis NCDO 2118]|uniref:Integrase n=1 Tax=Lactococcus lactis subsp. lactis NCDO 2118 TaxID=1117941 RepID=A0ABC8A2X6_LACLL|nr:hypothetical protein [Lactococcus lactis]ABX75676.1 Integrase, fragment [Lactococcus lactis subsp. lactis KF147]AII11625.1 Integrase [Lactococcus lactis subsp. lactis NCDO 2118]
MAILEPLKKAQNQVNIKLVLTNEENFFFHHYSLQNAIPNVTTVNEVMEKMLNELKIEPIITRKGARRYYSVKM